MRFASLAAAVALLTSSLAAAQPGPDQQQPPPAGTSSGTAGPPPAAPAPQQGPYAPGPYAPAPAPGPYAPSGPPGGYGPPGSSAPQGGYPQGYPQGGYGPQQGYYVPPPYQYQPRQPTPEEQDLMEHGYISDGQVIGGGLAALFLGFGIGQGIQGRWHERGWVFTLMDSVSLAGMLGGAIALANDCTWGDTCTENGGATAVLVISAISFTVFRVWEIGDAFIAPSSHNERVRDLRRTYGYRDYAKTIVPYLARPQSTDGGMTAGISMRF